MADAMSDRPETTAPTPADITRAVHEDDKHVSLVRRKIGSRYLIVHANWSTFVLGIGFEVCRFGILWFVGPFSFCVAKPARVRDLS